MYKFINALRWTVGTSLLFAALASGFASFSFSDDDDDDEEFYGSLLNLNSDQGQSYIEECSACHMAYPASLMPSRSWQALLDNLDNHFGENAELMPSTDTLIHDYLNANAGDVANSRLANRALRGLKSRTTPQRITELPFFDRQHHEVPDRYVTGNDQVGSFSQCQACHGDSAEQGNFNEDNVKIPGVPFWHD